ncbi:hypothetical protein SCOR_25695 [Sulfidibacter corallicola]|uniref:Uncharacterized protein n=1 Tax=Sulfidibacter corallicola TaxID=2818388 RepID=A0A8A4TT03_SULCO|nr:hypothetical protein [Sulfidibacter corallicola]QTD52208.1 hypothetical protein J3U87_07020 [Sulfidibacter corallicola]
MGRKFLRFIDSAQRRIEVIRPVSPSNPGLDRVCFQIQGMEVSIGDTETLYHYADMAEYGVRHGFAKPLGILDRLKRRPAPVAQLRHLDDGHIRLAFWNDGRLDLEFDLSDEDQAVLWRECEIMMLSAGYHVATVDPSVAP